MKLSTVLSFVTLGATAVLAAPLSPFQEQGNVERRVAHPVRRTEAPTETPTETSTETPTPTPTSTSTSSEASVTDTTDTYLYSTITDSSSFTWTTSTETRPRETGTVSRSTSTERPSQTGDVSVGVTEIIRIVETVQITEVLIVQRPVFVAVSVNVVVQQNIFVNQFQNLFISRFDNWDANLINQLALTIAQQYDFLIRRGHQGFDGLDNNVFNQFIGQYLQHFQIFQSFQQVQVQQFVIVLQSFNFRQLESFFGRSNALFSQDILNQFGVNNDFGIFVQQLTVIIDAISGSAFDDNDIFNLAQLLSSGGNSLSVL